MQKRQRERAFRLKEDQLRRARDEARDMNLKRSAEILEPRNNAEAAGNMQPVSKVGFIKLLLVSFSLENLAFV